MRVVLFTGKGGVGKTTAAAATAALVASRATGKTLVMSTDPAHSLGDALGMPLGPEPAEVAAGLYGMHVDTQRAFERSWAEIRGYLRELLHRGGADDLRVEELTVLPGVEEVLALLELRDRVRSGAWDVVVVDCAPTAETLRLLALPEALRWYMDRAFPTHRRVARSLRPVLARLASGPVMPGDGVFEAIARLHADLGEAYATLTEPLVASVRIVLTPESVVVAEARRAYTSLALYGFPVDGVVANKVLAAGPGADGWRTGWAGAQAEQLEQVRAGFGELPVHLAPYLPAEPVTVPALADLGRATYGTADPLALPPQRPLVELAQEDQTYVLRLALPLAERRDLQLTRSGDDLVVTVAGRRRLLALPAALRRARVAEARLREGWLVVRFAPEAAGRRRR